LSPDTGAVLDTLVKSCNCEGDRYAVGISYAPDLVQN
jgi:hypothetical protein